MGETPWLFDLQLGDANDSPVDAEAATWSSGIPRDAKLRQKRRSASRLRGVLMIQRHTAWSTVNQDRGLLDSQSLQMIIIQIQETRPTPAECGEFEDIGRRRPDDEPGATCPRLLGNLDESGSCARIGEIL